MLAQITESGSGNVFSFFLKPFFSVVMIRPSIKCMMYAPKLTTPLRAQKRLLPLLPNLASTSSRQHIATMTTPTSPPPPSTAKIVITISIIASAIICCVPGLWQVIIGCLTDHHPHHRPFYSHHDFDHLHHCHHRYDDHQPDDDH